MRLFVVLLILVIIWYQYRRGLISVAEADTGVFTALALGAIKL
jgi:hypothetical protein